VLSDPFEVPACKNNGVEFDKRYEILRNGLILKINKENT